MADGKARSAQWALATALLAVALRLAFALGYWTGQPLTRDEREYLGIARSLAQGDGFVVAPDTSGMPADPFGRAPGYPAFLAVVGGGRGVPAEVPVSVKVAQSIVGAAGVLLVGLVATQFAGARAGRVAALIAAVYPPLIWISAYAFSEAIFWPMGLAVAWLLSRTLAASTARVSWAIACGVMTGLAVLVRPGFLLFLPIACVWIAARHRHVGVAVALGLAATLTIAPWTARNYAHHGRFILVASEGGITFWTGNHPLARGEGDLAANPSLKLASQALRAQYPARTEEEMEPVYYRAAFDWIRAHPLDWLMLEMRKAFYLVAPIGPSYRLHSNRYFVASILSYGLVLPFAVLGFVRARARWSHATGLWLTAAAAVAACLVFFPQERFRIPSIDPALIVGAGAALASRRHEGLA